MGGKEPGAWELDSWTLAALLGNTWEGDEPFLYTLTPYKFVFMDSCETTFDNCYGGWPPAFGIKPYPYPYVLFGMKNRAYMGWKRTVWGQAWTQYFWQSWTGNVDQPLTDAIHEANTHILSIPNVLWSSIQVYGYDQLTWGE